MTEVTKRETRNRGERRPVVVASSPPRVTAPVTAKPTTKRKAQSPPRPQVPLKSRDAPGLPTLRKRQDVDLPAKEWKTVPESGVLTASLKLSMEKWRNGSCFEKYWVKNPVKKAHRDFQNPPSSSMSRLGSAFMIIEPHSFEVALYSVKPPVESNASQSSSSSKPTQPITQPIPPYRPTIKNDPTLQAGNMPGATGSVPSTVVTKPMAPKLTPKPVAQGLKAAPTVGQGIPSNTNSSNGNNTKSLQTTSAGPKPATQPPTDPPSNNPVIQELANRASQDVKLRDLMKIVAQGGANELQLKEFQRHIDDINKMLIAKANPKQTSKLSQKSSSGASRQVPPTTWTQPITANIKPEPGLRVHNTSNIKPKSMSSNKPDISAVVFEILSGTGDRYLIPRQSLLEFTEGTRLAVLSFLVHLKGANANGGFYQDEKEYCELITLKFLADRPGILDSLRRAVDPPDIVRQHMESWAVKMSIAEKAYLMLRLRSLPEGEELAEPQEALSLAKDDTPKTDYEAPNSLFPLQHNKLIGKA